MFPHDHNQLQFYPKLLKPPLLAASSLVRIQSVGIHIVSNVAAESQSKSTTAPLSASASAGIRSSLGRGPRTPIRRVGAQATKLESLDDSLGPLGPLGDNGSGILQSDQPPVPPQKEQVVTHNLRQPPLAPSQSSLSRSTMDSVDLQDDVEINPKPRVPPPVQPAQSGPVRRDTQPSVSIEQAAKPTFDITVGDPHKVGDLTSSHTVYQVRTKVSERGHWTSDYSS
jgi:sorting nexin-1/2